MSKENTGEKKPKLTVIRFIRSYTPYLKGEVAGFKKELAKQFIEKKIAIIYKKTK